MRRALEGHYRIFEAESAKAARDAIAADRPDLILLDVVMPGEGGIAFLRELRAGGDETPVLVVSALDTARTAVEALQAGAADYIVKGFDIEALRARVANTLKLAELGAENQRLRRELVAEGQFGRMLGTSAAMRRVFEMADRVAPTDATVLILGESGTGKDLLAQEIHARSPRAGKAFVAVNCAALPENLIESELFGYERGAFTGAAQQRKGKFELASGGTLFLDEIGDMNPVTQAKVLRALEGRKIERLGGSQSIDVDVRVISATHRDLPAEIALGKFREDLYYRLRVVIAFDADIAVIPAGSPKPSHRAPGQRLSAGGRGRARSSLGAVAWPRGRPVHRQSAHGRGALCAARHQQRADGRHRPPFPPRLATLARPAPICSTPFASRSPWPWIATA